MGGVVAATAAAAERQRRRKIMLAEEEEDMTGYTQDDLEGDWEFKIVRSDTAAFRRPEVLNKLIEEEAQAGWVMLEKFDDSRVRFKRPRSARTRDPFLAAGIDPYRTHYGSYAARQALLIGVTVGLVLLLGLGVVAMFLAQGAGSTSGPAVISAWTPITLVVLGFVVLLIALFRRKLR
jgi:hypothetical protein